MARQKQLDNVLIENARIIFKNFEGREGQYNREGDRNFSVVIPEEQAKQMQADGWNIKHRPPREEGDDDLYHIPVSVNFSKGRPPRVVIITSKGRTSLDEESVGVLDFADMRTVDLTLNPYQWAVNGNTGVKAYLKSIFVTINEDPLELKYADVPEIDLRGRPLEIAAEAHQEPDNDEIVIGEDGEVED
jgi:hypothetical protein